MNPTKIIQKKKYGIELTTKEIEYMVKGYTDNTIPDYQMAAFLMSIWFRGLVPNESVALTNSMVRSGETLNLSLSKPIIDKHSTGGVGDKVSLIVAPIVASLGIPCLKLSGRGLGHTGGTIDKLESIRGFKTNLSKEEIVNNIQNHDIVIAGQTENIVPADKKIYALRDVTSTVDSIPLIASSIMSKKIALGANKIVLDIKVGNGSFMKTIEDATVLGKTMVEMGKNMGRETVAVLTGMNQPLGYEIGNLNEVIEAVDLLKNKKFSKDLWEVVIEISGQMIYLSEKSDNIEDAKKMAQETIDNRSAYLKFIDFVQAQGGDIESIHSPNTKETIEIKSESDGYISHIETQYVGESAMLLGAGRKGKDDKIDHSVGITIRKKLGAKVKKGDTLFIVKSNQHNNEDVINKLKNSVTISKDKIETPKTIIKVIH
ncbi:thymidine phosphorylase [Siminovitchia sp. 179-K 8D1 HS]|uniref:thymidine phosphorylase n=1 Tax=Siminovitchia sp. 179-K 8D1 HS TaxID=3142385 RepID=UPI0039A21150